MATVSMAQGKELRERTQAGMSDCKKSLVEADGDIEKAVELILKKGLVKSAKRAGAAASEGVVATESAADAKSKSTSRLTSRLETTTSRNSPRIF